MLTSLSQGAVGPAVGAIHQALLEAGESVPQSELSSSTFGPGTEAAVKEYQAHHVDAQGHALGIDGIVGPATWAALTGAQGAMTAPGWHYVPPEDTTARAVCEAAVADLGRKEDPDGSNDGPDLVKFGTRGRPWCALAVSTWYAQAPGGSPFGVQASVLGLVTWGRAHTKLVAAAKPGALACILRAGGHGHVALVVSVNPDGSFCTVEGNCSNAVRGCIRRPADITAFVAP